MVPFSAKPINLNLLCLYNLYKKFCDNSQESTDNSQESTDNSQEFTKVKFYVIPFLIEKTSLLMQNTKRVFCHKLSSLCRSPFHFQQMVMTEELIEMV